MVDSPVVSSTATLGAGGIAYISGTSSTIKVSHTTLQPTASLSSN